MLKTFIIKDEEGKQFEVTEEMSDEEAKKESEHDEDIKKESECDESEHDIHDDEELTSDEIVALKKLAAYSADLIKLLEVEKEEHEANAEGDDEEDEDLDDAEDLDEEVVIDTKTSDSKKSIGAVAKKVVQTSDSTEDRETAITDAWTKRFKTSYKKGE